MSLPPLSFFLTSEAYTTLPYAFAFPTFFGLTAFYLALAPFFSTEKARAYILSTAASLTMSSLSIPFFYLYITKGFALAYPEIQTGWMDTVGQCTSVFFGTYLLVDLVVGYLFYPSQVGLLTGWIHHTVYIGIMINTLNSRQYPILLIGAVMEMPTFDLSISHLFPSVRNDGRFLSLMFLTRIFFHAIFLLDCARPSSRAVMEGSWVPVGILSLALFLHVSWFRGGLAGYLKRQRALARKEKEKAKGTYKTSATLEKDGEGVTSELRSEQAGLNAAVDADPTILQQLPSPRTPEDSPVVTPYTPSQTPMTLRDSYLFPSLGFPTLSDMAAALPGGKRTSLGQQNVGFREAVRHRWEEQKERLAAHGVNLNFGNLGLRRRKDSVQLNGAAHDPVDVRVEEVEE